MTLQLRAPIVLSFRHPAARASVFLVLSCIRAAIISYFVYVAFVYPIYILQSLEGPVLYLARLLQVPIYLFSMVSPLGSPFGFGPHLSPPGFDGGIDLEALRAAHMQAGIIAYVLLFHTPALYRIVAARLKSHRS